MPTYTIFPPFHPHKSWRPIDDRIRGGSSVSHLDPLPDSSGGGGVRFWGTLDTQTLGGAGFASQCRAFDEVLRLPADQYAGLAITVIVPPSNHSQLDNSVQDEKKQGPVKPYEYTVTLKTAVPELRPDGRRESNISYEHTFPIPHNRPTTTTTPNPTHRLVIPWHAFTATYRGRTLPTTDPSYIPLNPGSTSPTTGKPLGGIHELSFMCRSAFGRQEGAFELWVARVEAVGVEEVGKKTWDIEAQGSLRRRFRGTLPASSLSPSSRHPRNSCLSSLAAVSWKTLGLAAVVCVGLTVAVRYLGWRA